MRRKSERTATKKTKASPEKTVEKAKRARTRRRKQSTSTENESADEGSPVQVVESVVEPEKKLPQTPVKELSPEEAQDQIWRVKTSEGSGDIQKLKICLTRPPSTPERVDRSPRSKRKQSRATSSSDTPSVEGVDDKKKTKHRSKRTPRDSKDGSEKSHDSHGEEPDNETDSHQDQDKCSEEVTQSEAVDESETPMSTTNEEVKINESDNMVQSSQELPENRNIEKMEHQETNKTDADTTVVSPKDEIKVELTKDAVSIGSPKDATSIGSSKDATSIGSPKDATSVGSSKDATRVGSPEDATRAASQPEEKTSESNLDPQKVQPSNVTENKSSESTNTTEKESPKKKRLSVEKLEVLDLHAEDSKCESSDNDAGQFKEEPKEKPIEVQDEKKISEEKKVSINEEMITNETEKINSDREKPMIETDVVASSDNVVKETNQCKMSTDSTDKPVEKTKHVSEQEIKQSKELQCSDSTKATKQESVANGQSAPVVVSRKRRWGCRSSKLTKQKSITISTDVLKDIIPDVKPVEFDEVIEEKKHRRSENQERIERPVLPKIVIDNTENVEQKKESDEKEKDTPKPRDLATNRKISIIKENDSIITRPPSPPRNKQSCILYITNLVRPFTLPQLKNLLQRTGRIIENGFWIDRIKSKCFVQYETEDQAVETRHALHGVTWPVSNPKALQVDFSTKEAFDKAKTNEELDSATVSSIPGTVEDWLREQDMKRERGELEKPWERKAVTREWDLGKNDKDKEKDKMRRDDRPMDKRRHRTPEKSPEPARKFKKKEEEAPAKLLDDLFRKTKTTPCIYWLPLSAETIAIKEEQRRQHMAEHERRLQELRRTHRRH